MSHYFSIDPGMSGCIAVLDHQGHLLAHHHLRGTTVGKARRLDVVDAACFLREHCVEMAYLEKVSAMPGQGVSSMFNFGHAAGALEGALSALGVGVSLITPASWKKRYGLVGAGKDAARAKLSMLMPEVADLRKMAKGQALADAVLIGYAGLGIELGVRR